MRTLLNWTVRDLAELTGVNRNTVTRVEADVTGPGYANDLNSLCSRIGVIFVQEHGEGLGVRLWKRGAGGDFAG